MAATVAQMLALMEGIAPRELAEEWDNVGLLAGRPDAGVEKVLVALDLTGGALDEAAALGVQLIVTHHPILFRGRKNLREDDPEGALLCRLVRQGVALIAAHTNFDNANPGLNDQLAAELGLKDVQTLEHGLRVGTIDCALGELDALCRMRLGGCARIYGPERARIGRLAVCGGSGGEFWPTAQAAGADALLTGEVRHHDALNAVAVGMWLCEAGHFHTERVSVKALRKGLQNAINAVQYNVSVYESAFEPFC